jgi:hypothetical protein
MKTRVALALAAASGLAATVQAQELIRVSYTWNEVVGLTTTPVTNPNSVLDPGEGARINLTIQALINGTSAVGQTTSYTPPPPPGSGTVRGIASMIYNLVGDNNATTAQGSWGARSVSSVLSTGAFTGNVLNNGSQLDSFGGGQFVAPGGTANSSNPIANAFRGVWQPNSYAGRTVNFKAAAGTAAPSGQQNGILVAYGITMGDPTDPTTWYDNLLTKYVSSDFQTGINIPISPAPSSVALLGLGALVAGKRRRR